MGGLQGAAEDTVPGKLETRAKHGKSEHLLPGILGLNSLGQRLKAHCKLAAGSCGKSFFRAFSWTDGDTS